MIKRKVNKAVRSEVSDEVRSEVSDEVRFEVNNEVNNQVNNKVSETDKTEKGSEMEDRAEVSRMNEIIGKTGVSQVSGLIQESGIGDLNGLSLTSEDRVAETERILGLIRKGTDQVVGEDDLREKLLQGRTLVVKLGLDPTAPDIHLGHTVVLRKMKLLQDLGHQVVIIIGDFTGKIGDPSGKSKTRVQLTDEEVRRNAATYFEQVFRVLDREKTQIKYNSEWLGKLSLSDSLAMAACVTVARMLERDDFKNRFESGTPIGIHEFMYPLLQARDSIALEADIEVGGTDQTFNLLMGRTLQKSFGQSPQAVITLPLLAGTDGVLKMSKSLGNYIGISEPARVMFQKVMSIPDHLIIRYFELVTDETPEAIAAVQTRLDAGANPRDEKLRLARTITRLYWSENETAEAERFFRETFSLGILPQDVPLLSLQSLEESEILQAIKRSTAISTSELRRMLDQSGIQVNGEKVTSLGSCESGDILKVGKKKFFKLDLRA